MNHGSQTRGPDSSAQQPIRGLHHAAWRCRDAEETRHFYEDILGLPLVHVVKEEIVPSTGEFCPFVHLFFEFADGSHIAFFDLGDNQRSAPDPNMPAWVHHFAMEVSNNEELEGWQSRLLAAGVDVRGVTDHHFIRSIYFHDPNGIRLELTVRQQVDSYMAERRSRAAEDLAQWTAEKATGLRPGASGTSSKSRAQSAAEGAAE